MSFFRESCGELILDSRAMGRIHSASLDILRETGMALGLPEAVEVCRSHGLSTSGETVFFSDKIVEKTLEMMPDEFTLRAVNPENDIDFSPASQAVGPGSGAVYVAEANGRGRLAEKSDFLRAAKLAQMLPQMKFCRHLFVPHNVEPARMRSWMMVQQALTQDKPYYLMGADDVPILAKVFGRGPDEMREDALLGRVSGLSTVSIISPLYMSAENCANLIAFCRSGVTFSVTSMPSAGSSAPCSLTAAIVLQNCENLASMVLAQLISPGHPVFYGAMGGHSDMRTFNPIYGSPENRLVEMAGARLSRYYGLLSRGAGGASTDAMTVDFQAGAEGMFELFAATMEKVNLLPGCGHLGSYMGGSLEKMVVDAELYEYLNRLTRPLRFGDDDLATDIIKEIGPKGNYLNHPHTFKRFRGEFYQPKVFYRGSYERWKKEGAPGVLDAARARVKALLESYKAPDLEKGLKRDLMQFID